MTEKIKKHIDINAPVPKVFDYMSDPRHFLDIWPSMVDIENIERTDEGVRSYDWTYKMAGLKFKGTSITEEAVENERTVVVNKKGIPSTFVWEYHPHNGGTALDVEIEYDIPTPVLGKFAEKAITRINDREADTLLANLKTVMEL